MSSLLISGRALDALVDTLVFGREWHWHPNDQRPTDPFFRPVRVSADGERIALVLEPAVYHGLKATGAIWSAVAALQPAWAFDLHGAADRWTVAMTHRSGGLRQGRGTASALDEALCLAIITALMPGIPACVALPQSSGPA